MTFKRYALAFMLAATPGVAVAADNGGCQDNAKPQKKIFPLRSVTAEGGPIATQHFQPMPDNFNERHKIGIFKVETANRGTWGIYTLVPNSVRKTSIGFGYVTDPLNLPLPLVKSHLELTGIFGTVTGYSPDYPIILLAGQARVDLYKKGPWDLGLSMASNPYLITYKGERKFGAVVTTPFLSVKYNF